MAPPKSVECPHCGRQIGNGTGLASHIRAMHPEHARLAPAPPPEPEGLVWEDPPPRGGRTNIVNEVAATVIELRRNPGKWARVKTFDKKHGAQGAQTKLKSHEAYADIAWAARTFPDGTSGLWGQYTGE